MIVFTNLYDVYNAVSGTDTGDGTHRLIPVGFIEKKVKFNVLISPNGDFITARTMPESEQLCIVPTTPQAEGRTSTSIVPFPLVDSLKYMVNSKYLESYMQQLGKWCSEPDAPNALRALLKYLSKQTLYNDMAGIPGLKLKYYKDEKNHTGEGADAKSLVCFSISCPFEEQRIWMRQDVIESWTRRFNSIIDEKSDLCYITGERLPIMENYPKVLGNAKLISAKDTGFPFQYKGRFIADRSSATVSTVASTKAHNALKWLLKRQSFNQFDMHFVAWHTVRPELYDEADDDPYAEKPNANTLDGYVRALFNAVKGYAIEYLNKTDLSKITDEQKQRIGNVIIIGMQAATSGRMSIIYDQEIPGNVFVLNVEKWLNECNWQMTFNKETLAKEISASRPATWTEICNAIMGPDAVTRAYKNPAKADAKLMRDIQLRLLHCVINAEKLPASFVTAAFNRAVQPSTFTDADGKWDVGKWLNCVNTTCAMIRKYRLDQKLDEIKPQLDVTCRDRDYLYGRLFAIAHYIEQAATGDFSSKTNAVRLMTHFRQRPTETWLLLYQKILPYLKTIGNRGDSKGRLYLARYYLKLLGQVESLFDTDNEAALSRSPLSHMFLAGFSSQTAWLNLKPDSEYKTALPPLTNYEPPRTRDELFGCLLAVADNCEWRSESYIAQGDAITVDTTNTSEKADEASKADSAAAVNKKKYLCSIRDGRTNALLLTSSFIARPTAAWRNVHDKLIPYLEKSGVRTARYTQKLLCKLEQCFVPEERLDGRPLGRGFLHGFLMMYLALAAPGGLNKGAWNPAKAIIDPPQNRDAAFGALLALENDVERLTLDMDKSENENRPSNAMRFMTSASRRPDSLWEYLDERMKPYARKLCFSQYRIARRANALHELIETKGWNTDTPLGPEYIYYFYMYSNAYHRKDGQ